METLLFVLSWTIAIFIIGLLIHVSKKKHEKREKEQSDELESYKLSEAVEKGTEDQFRKVVDALNIKELPTINIYKSEKLFLDLHNALIRMIQTHLVEARGFHLAMLRLDIEAMYTWECPVLVIYPKRNMYYFMEDQTGDRSNSVNFKIETNCISSIIANLDIQINLMEE